MQHAAGDNGWHVPAQALYCCKRLRELGAVSHRFLPQHASLVEMERDAVRRVAAEPFVRSVTPFHVGWKLSSELFADDDNLYHYHMVFLPCFATELGFDFIDGQTDHVREYVAAGGKTYTTCCANYWNEYSFMEYIDYNGDDQGYWDLGIGRVGLYNTNGQVLNDEMRDWLVEAGWNKEPPAPTLPPDVIEATSQRYRSFE